MRGRICGLALLAAAVCCCSCRTSRVTTTERREEVRMAAADTSRHETRLLTDTLRAEQVRDERDSLREVEDVRVEVDYNEAGKPAVVRIHRERTGTSGRKTWQNEVALRVIRDTAAVTIHTESNENAVETVAHERAERAAGIGIRKRYILVTMALVLLALVAKLRRMDR